MSNLKVCVVLSVWWWWWCMVTGSLFHEDSRVLLLPNRPANYFGYSLLLRNSTPPRLVVGAPIAKSTHEVHAGLGDTGAVYSCSLVLTGNPQNITCTSLEFDTEGNSVNTNGRGISVHHYKNEMWLGAALADVNNGSLVMCAPRWANQVESQRSSHRLVNGLCYITSGTRAGLLVPLADMAHQAYLPSGPGIYDKGTALNYFAYGQAGFSARVSPDQGWLLLGAPGLLQWTGGIAKYSITHRIERGDDYFGKQPVHNPFFTKQLQPDSYFGYSVDAGVFEIGGDTLGVGGAPRGKGGLGQVLIFILKGGGDSTGLRIKAELSGSQLGSYFGGTLLVVDVNADGRADLLVGAPLYADRNLEKMPYDQGVVYVYLNRPKTSGFTMELVDTLTGSGASGARFGSALADLGDVDDAESTSYPEIAIGAPWEAEGRGAVYIYKSGCTGVGRTHVQKISPECMGFGFSIARSLDVDGNGCNDLVVGALNSDQVILYRCTRTIHVSSEIKVPSEFDLPENSTDFTVEFCVIAAETKQHSAPDIGPVSIGVVVTVSVDVGAGRATLTGDSEYTEPQVEPGRTYCKQRRVDINPSADLSRPLTLTMSVRVAPGYPPKGQALGPGVRLGTTSRQNASLDVQLTRDCGEDLICQPRMSLHVSSLSSSPYVPGSDERLGAAVHVVNVGEPAYGACVKITLPRSPLRVPSDCRYDGMELTCELQRPFYRRAEADWTLEIDDTSTIMEDYDLVIKARVYESCADTNGKAHTGEDLMIRVAPQAKITVVGYSPPNMTISREKFKEGGDYDFGHSFAVTNFGPSNLPVLEVEFSLPPEVSLIEEVPECVRAPNSTDLSLSCSWSLPAHRQHTALLLLRLNLHERGYLLEQGTMNITTNVYIKYDNITVEVTSIISLEASPPLWPIIVGVLLGHLLIAVITFGLYKAGFFGRAQRERLDKLKKELASKVHAPDSMEDVFINRSDLQLHLEQNSREPSPLSDFYAIK